MRPSTLLLATFTAAVSAQDFGSFSEALASITADPAYSSLVAEYQSADPTSLYQSASALAVSALDELSEQAATATGSDGAYLSGLYTSLQAGLSSANAMATSALTITGTNTGSGAQQTGGAGSSNDDDSYDDSSDSSDDASESASSSVEAQSGNGAAATAVPIALGAVGMAVLGML